MWRAVLLSLLTVAVPLSARVDKDKSEDRTLSPYFWVQSDDPAVDRLPLLSTSAEVDIAGVIADVRVTQVYKNEGKKPIEAVYVFPASTRAAVYAMKMTIGDRTITAKINEREKARQDYENAVKQGRTASLLEQERPNVFQMSVGNIMPGDFVRVEMSYTELLVPEGGVYEFVYPTVVGPRYSNVPEKRAKPSESWIKSPYQHEGKKPMYTFGMNVNLEAGMPIAEVVCATHKTNVRYNGLSSARITLDASEKEGGNRDFVLRYRLAGGKVQSGILLSQGKDENFFLLMVQPPKRVEEAQIPPREYVFIVDVSGSMYGFPLEVSKRLLRNLLTGVRETDYFNVLLFSGNNAVLSEEPLPATQKNISRALEVIDEQRGGGGTELLPALKRALSLPKAEGTSRTVVIATDGYVTVETEAFDIIRKNLGKANMFVFGIGSSVNRFIIEGMARVGMGEPFVVEDEKSAQAQAEKFRKYVERPVLTDISVEYQGFQTYDVEPQTIPDVLADRPIVIFGKYRGKATGSVVVKGQTASGPFYQLVNLAQYSADEANSGLRFLWARHRIQLLGDYNQLAEDDERVKEITRLGLKYSLLTQYTSFVAIDSRVRNKDGRSEVVEQPLPLPEGVSDYAVGDASGAGWYGATGLGGGRTMKRLACPAPRSNAQTVCEAECRAVDEDHGLAGYSGLLKGTVAIGEVKTGEGISEASVKRILGGYLHSIQSAYSQALGKNPKLAGSIKIKFTVRSDATVAELQLVRNDLTDEIGKAVKEAFRSISFPNSLLEGERVQVTVTLLFAP